MTRDDENAARAGLCADCQHCRIVQSARSTFYMCQRSFTDPEYRKYPPLPVFRCAGYEPREGSNGEKHSGKLTG